jgi:hypothetical protein
MAFTNIDNFEKSRKKKEGDIRKEQRGLLSTTASIAPNLSVLGTTHLHIVHVINLGLPGTNHLCFLLAPPSGLGHKFCLEALGDGLVKLG